MGKPKKRSKVVDVVYSVLRDEMAIPIDDLSRSAPLAPLADTDDWSFTFFPELEKRLNVSIPAERCSEAGTIDEMADLLIDLGAE